MPARKKCGRYRRGRRGEGTGEVGKSQEMGSEDPGKPERGEWGVRKGGEELGGKWVPRVMG